MNQMSFLKSIISGMFLAAFSLAAGGQSAVQAKSAWVDMTAPKFGIAYQKHVVLKPTKLNRKVIENRTYLAAWTWPAPNKTTIELSVLKYPGTKSLRSILEEMDGKPVIESRPDKRPALRTETLFEAVLSRRYLIQDTTNNRIFEVSISIQGVNRWMERKPAEIRKEFKEALWVATKMARSIRFIQ